MAWDARRGVCWVVGSTSFGYGDLRRGSLYIIGDYLTA